MSKFTEHMPFVKDLLLRFVLYLLTKFENFEEGIA